MSEYLKNYNMKNRDKLNILKIEYIRKNPLVYFVENGSLSLLKWDDIENADPLCRKHFENRFTYCKLTTDAAPTVAL